MKNDARLIFVNYLTIFSGEKMPNVNGQTGLFGILGLQTMLEIEFKKNVFELPWCPRFKICVVMLQ